MQITQEHIKEIVIKNINQRIIINMFVGIPPLPLCRSWQRWPSPGSPGWCWSSNCRTPPPDAPARCSVATTQHAGDVIHGRSLTRPPDAPARCSVATTTQHAGDVIHGRSLQRDVL